MPERTKTLTKKDVARKVAETMEEPIYKSEPWVSAVLDAMSEMMMEADPEVRIELRGFGVFEVKKTKAKPKARNPQTNETVFIPSRRKTHFRPSKRLKEVLQVPLREQGYAIPEGSADEHLEDLPAGSAPGDGAPASGAPADGALLDGQDGPATNGPATNGPSTNGRPAQQPEAQPEAQPAA